MSYRVLAVDDSLLMRRKVEKSLKDTEFELVATAGDGAAAVEQFKEVAPDLVLLDIVMPKMDGPSALKEIIALDDSARVIMVSSLGTDEAVTSCLEAGALRFIQKPFTTELLLKTLRAVCAS
jgi:two-component system, chemotaxis family, chemotaxis protein CheY